MHGLSVKLVSFALHRPIGLIVFMCRAYSERRRPYRNLLLPLLGAYPLEGVGYCLEFEMCSRKSLKKTIHQRDKYLFCMYCIHKLFKLTFT